MKPESNALPQLIMWHLLPGLAGTAAYVVLAPISITFGYPGVLALLLSALLVIMPIEVGMLIRRARQGSRSLSFDGAVRFREHLPKWQLVALSLALVIWGLLASGLTAPLDLFLLDRWFAWLPDWFALFDARQLAPFSRSALLVTFWVGLAVNGVILPVVEEFYFRGYLLPHMNRLGRWAPLVNTSLFSLYHFWSPWQLFSRIIWLFPWVYATWAKRNLYPTMIAHCTANTLGWLLFWASILT
ncbi:MAG: CPBP family intramembrane glutamic endopeptidase [Anaerolineales bacterium]